MLFNTTQPTYEKGSLFFFPVVVLSQKRVRCERAAGVARRDLGSEPQLEEDVHMTYPRGVGIVFSFIKL
jgi:hypothetical protein